MTLSQCDRVLALLRARGDAGVNTSELQEVPIVDGGMPILRLAARIGNLKARGFVIESRRERNGTASYVLVSEPGVEQAPGGSVMPRRPSAVLEPPAAQASALPTSPSGDGGSTPPAPAEPSGLFDASEFEPPRRAWEDAA